jgi:sialate O-acetylesterase
MKVLLAFVLSSFLLQVYAAISPFTLPLYFNDNMILQRSPAKPVIWGFANTNSVISTTINGKAYSAQAVALAGTTQYRWTLVLNPTQASNTSIDITLTETRSDGVSTLTIKNVLFGDVWFCSGQSNMQLSLTKDIDGASEISTGSQYDKIRLLSVDLRRSYVPVNDAILLKHKWTQPTAAILGKGDWSSFSAVCWYYGKQLHLQLGVPVGLIVTFFTLILYYRFLHGPEPILNNGYNLLLSQVVEEAEVIVIRLFGMDWLVRLPAFLSRVLFGTKVSKMQLQAISLKLRIHVY